MLPRRSAPRRTGTDIAEVIQAAKGAAVGLGMTTTRRTGRSEAGAIDAAKALPGHHAINAELSPRGAKPCETHDKRQQQPRTQRHALIVAARRRLHTAPAPVSQSQVLAPPSETALKKALNLLHQALFFAGFPNLRAMGIEQHAYQGGKLRPREFLGHAG